MIISEKQIMQLIDIANQYIQTLNFIHDTGDLTEAGQNNKDFAQKLLSIILRQQSQELKDIK